MAGVTVDSGQFKLMRDVDIAHQPSRSKVYNEWINAFSYNVPDAVEHLADVIEDVYTFELWKDYYLDTAEQFFERIGLFGLNLDEPAKLIKELRKAKSSKKAEIIRRAEKAKELREEGKTQREIADELGVTDRTIRSDLKAEENPARAEKISSPRQQTRYAIYGGTKPETAARRIREVFGDEFADSLAICLSV